MSLVRYIYCSMWTQPDDQFGKTNETSGQNRRRRGAWLSEDVGRRVNETDLWTFPSVKLNVKVEKNSGGGRADLRG